jgi:hypothetical protein
MVLKVHEDAEIAVQHDQHLQMLSDIAMKALDVFLMLFPQRRPTLPDLLTVVPSFNALLQANGEQQSDGDGA